MADLTSTVDTSSSERFAESFARWAGRVRRRATLRTALTGAMVGLFVGAVAAGVLWKTRHGALRPWMGAAGLVGAIAGAAWAQRRRWTDEQVGLYLDGRLGSREVITTALGLRPADGPAATLLVGQATQALDQGDPRAVRPPVVAPWHGAGVLAAAALVYASLAPLPALPAAPPPPGVDRVQMAEIKGLDRVEALAKLRTPDEEQRKRLDKLAREAAELREKLRQGVERREALAEIARLQDAIQQERLQLGDGERKQGLEAALERMAREGLLKDAARALGDRDLVRFDEEMQKLANSREKEDRERAKKALEEAAEAARKAKAEDVARALERQKELLEQRGQKADELRALGDALKDGLSPEQQQELQGQGIDSKDARKAARALGDALKKLTPEQRKRVADNLKKKMQQGQMDPATRDRVRDLARDLSTPEGQQQLEDELRRLAEEESDEGAQQQEGLDGAQEGLGQAQGELGGAPMPVPVEGPGQGKGDGQGDGKGKGDGKGDGKGKGKGDGKSDGDGNGGEGDGGGKGDHQGQSKDVGSDALRSRARSRLDSRAPTAGMTIGRSAGREGDTASRQGTGALGRVGPSEVSGVDGNEVPEEYREQVGRYFQP